MHRGLHHLSSIWQWLYRLEHTMVQDPTRRRDITPRDDGTVVWLWCSHLKSLSRLVSACIPLSQVRLLLSPFMFQPYVAFPVFPCSMFWPALRPFPYCARSSCTPPYCPVLYCLHLALSSLRGLDFSLLFWFTFEPRLFFLLPVCS